MDQQRGLQSCVHTTKNSCKNNWNKLDQAMLTVDSRFWLFKLRQKGAPVEKDYLTYTIEEASWERLEMTYNIIKPETAALKIEKDKTNKTLIGL